MRKRFLTIALVPAVLLLAMASGCNMVDSPSATLDTEDYVIKEEFCVTFNENRTSGNFQSEIVCDQFRTDIEAWIAGAGVQYSDICKIMTNDVRICLPTYEGHDWDVTSKVNIERLDINDGPHTLLKLQTVTIPDTYDQDGFCKKPKSNYRGIRVINRALEDLVAGGNPLLQVTMAMTDVDPEPSQNDPLVFSWDACVTVLAVVGDCD